MPSAYDLADALVFGGVSWELGRKRGEGRRQGRGGEGPLNNCWYCSPLPLRGVYIFFD